MSKQEKGLREYQMFKPSIRMSQQDFDHINASLDERHGGTSRLADQMAADIESLDDFWV